MVVADAVVRAQAVAATVAMVAARAPVRRVAIAMTVATTAVANSSPRVRNRPARRKARAVDARWEMACRSNPLVMPMSRVNRVLRPVSQTRCAPAWT